MKRRPRPAGSLYRARNSGDIDRVFASMAKDLQDAYLSTYRQPESEAGASWRAIQVVVLGANKPMRVRARTGYQPQ